MSENDANIKRVFLFTPNRDYVRPYFERYMPDFEFTGDINHADYAIMVSSTDIYDVTQGLNFNELTPLKIDGQEYYNEKEFECLCKSACLRPLILRCANIVATGMKGPVRNMADHIYRGFYLNIVGNEAVISAVHAVDLPKFSLKLLDLPGIYNVTDGTSVYMNELADALAWRLGQKRIFSIKASWYRLFYGRKKYSLATRSLTYSSEKLLSEVDCKPTSVIEYLKTHVYDSQSL